MTKLEIFQFQLTHLNSVESNCSFYVFRGILEDFHFVFFIVTTDQSVDCFASQSGLQNACMIASPPCAFWERTGGKTWTDISDICGCALCHIRHFGGIAVPCTCCKSGRTRNRMLPDPRKKFCYRCWCLQYNSPVDRLCWKGRKNKLKSVKIRKASGVSSSVASAVARLLTYYRHNCVGTAIRH